jgi:hypothetical protein
MKNVIEKVIKVDKGINGEVSIFDSSGIEHYCEETKLFLSSKEADDFAKDEDIEDFVREDFMDNMYGGIYSEVWMEPTAFLNSSHIIGEIDTVEVSELSVDELNEYDIYLLLNNHPNYEVKEMKYEIDGVVSVKKVLVEKELEVA